MALWILNRPAEIANLGELRVAELLARLSDEWVIRWGFHYEDNADVTREGDFLVLGPHGGLMVIEVKGGALEVFPSTGRWDTGELEHPLNQLDAEWKAVVNVVNDNRGSRPALYVKKALALPNLKLPPNLASYRDIPRSMILCEEDLRCFEQAWAQRFGDENSRLDGRSRQIFFDTFGQGAKPESMRHFVDEVDRALLRHTEGNYELLDQLSENRQFLVKGGTGSGKTWMALEQARRWAEEGAEGSQVLFLCYNLALTDFLREMVLKARQRGKPSRGRIEVMSWEELAKSLLKNAGLPYEVPEDDTEKVAFFTHYLPSLMADVAQSGACGLKFDALVVDEAQDHDTGIAAFPDNWEGPGWWGIYWKLLREASRARVAAFYDPAQRPPFRKQTSFEDSQLYRSLRENPVRVQLNKSVRYSRPILNFLRGLRTPHLAMLVDALKQKGSLPEGPDVITTTVGRERLKATVHEIIEKWVDSGLCSPDEILLLSQHGHLGKSALEECTTLGGCLIRDFLRRQRGCVSRTSVNRAKGLDARGVILIDFPPFESITDEDRQISYFMGASRARQLLAIIHTGA